MLLKCKSVKDALLEIYDAQNEYDQIDNQLDELMKEIKTNPESSRSALGTCERNIAYHQVQINHKISNFRKVSGKQDTKQVFNFDSLDKTERETKSVFFLISQFLQEAGYATVDEALRTALMAQKNWSLPPSIYGSQYEELVKYFLHRITEVDHILDGETDPTSENLIESYAATRSNKVFDLTEKEVSFGAFIPISLEFELLQRYKSGGFNEASNFIREIANGQFRDYIIRLSSTLVTNDFSNIDTKIQEFLCRLRNKLLKIAHFDTSWDLSLTPLKILMEAGAITMNKARISLSKTDIFRFPEKTEIGLELGYEHNFHAIFVCPVLKEPVSESNISALPCGHLVSRTALRKMATEFTNVQCPCCYRNSRKQEARDCKLYLFYWSLKQ